MVPDTTITPPDRKRLAIIVASATAIAAILFVGDIKDQKRRLSKLLQEFGMAPGRTDMAGQAVVDRRGFDSLDDRGGSAGGVAIEQDRHLLDARGQDRARHGGGFPAAQLAKDLERIIAHTLIARAADSGGDRFGIIRPVRGLTAKQRETHGRSGARGLGDDDARDQQIGLLGQGLHAERHGGGRLLLAHRGLEHHVRRRPVDR